MTDESLTPGASPDVDGGAGTSDRTLVEDLLLVLFQSSGGVFAGETTLYYVLAGGVLAELGLDGRVATEPGALGTTRVAATGDTPPDDELLRTAWEYVRERPHNVQTVLAAVGPELRARVLARLLEHGDLREVQRKVLGIIPTKVLELGDTGRHEGLISKVRAVLVDGATPTPRLAALIALLSGSGTLSWFHRDIPWTSPVITRAKELERGDWGAGAAAEAVTRTMVAIITSSLVAALAIQARK